MTPSEQTTERIVQAAIGLWAEKGYADTTMRELARRAGMGTSSLYAYFSSKEAIVQHLYERLGEQAIARYRAGAEPGASLGASLQRFLRLKLEILAPHRTAWPTLMREAIDPDSSLSPLSAESSGTLDRSLGLFREMVRATDVPAERLEAAARLVWMIHVGVVVYWLHDRSPERRDTEALIHRLGALGGLLPLLDGLPAVREILRLLAALTEPASAPTPEVEAPEPGERQVDVVVIGGGPIGCLFASFLHQVRPQTSVLVLDRQTEPAYKVGESTLSGFCKALRTVGLRQDALERLFYPKNGLGFLHLTEGIDRLVDAPEYVLETFDETFQVERRVLDSLVLANTRRLGVQVLQGATVDLRASSLAADGSRLVYRIGAREHRVRAKLVVDASGSAGLIPRAKRLWTDEGLPFQTSATWSYWTGGTPLARRPFPAATSFPRDEYTQHLCFREGWVWVIPLWSWREAPHANLAPLLDRVLRQGPLPERGDLAARYGCPVEPLTSVGLVIRSDRDDTLRDDARGAFDVYRRRYPAFGDLLEGASRVPNPYGHGDFGQRLDLRGFARRAVGDGWLAVGDAAFFVDPLISPGLTGGAATAWQAARQAARALEADRFSEADLSPYDAFVRRLHTGLERDNQLVYLSFAHPEALRLVQRLQEVDARRHFRLHDGEPYGEADTNVWGILDPHYAQLQEQCWELLRTAEQKVDQQVPPSEQSPRDYEGAVADLRHLLGPYLDEHASLTPYHRRTS